MTDQQSLRRLFCPSSIAVVGASATSQKIGAVPVSLLRKFGYAGEIYPVNPNAPEVQGLKCYPSLQAIGKPVDMVVLAVPAPLAQAAAELRPVHELAWEQDGLHLRLTGQGPWVLAELVALADSTG